MAERISNLTIGQPGAVISADGAAESVAAHQGGGEVSRQPGRHWIMGRAPVGSEHSPRRHAARWIYVMWDALSEFRLGR